MQYNVYDYAEVIIGQVEANDAVEAWNEAGKRFENILDVREVETLDYSRVIFESRARRLVEDNLSILSQKYNVLRPKIIFQPMKYTEAKFEDPITILVEENYAKIVDTAKTPEWDKFLITIVAHEFKHYLQYLVLGRSLSTIPNSQYREYEREAEDFGIEYGGIPYEKMSYMIAWANGISAKYLVEKIPMEKAIWSAKAELPMINLGE